jgi:hypothetical protein
VRAQPDATSAEHGAAWEAAHMALGLLSIGWLQEESTELLPIR